LDCRICRPRKRSETTTATLLASDARSARLMDDMTILALAPKLRFVTGPLDHFAQHLTRIRLQSAIYFCLHRGSLPENTAGRQTRFGAKPALKNFRKKTICQAKSLKVRKSVDFLLGNVHVLHQYFNGCRRRIRNLGFTNFAPRLPKRDESIDG
jgi:hypothetical protein